jgi:hypothetical protein
MGIARVARLQLLALISFRDNQFASCFFFGYGPETFSEILMLKGLAGLD